MNIDWEGTRPLEISRQMVEDVINDMCVELGYSEAEAWEEISDRLLFALEEHQLDPPSIEEYISFAEDLRSIKIVGPDEMGIV